jgi:flagellin-like hook-associated protein FlgL
LTPLHNPLAEEQINPPSKVDVVFLVDDSGSMGPEIDNLKSSIQGFKTRLQAVSTDVRFGLMAIGKGEDATDAADLVAQIGASDFDAQLAALGTGAGRLMDTYAAASEALGGSDTAGTQEPDLLLFDDDAEKRLIILTDTNAQEGAALDPPDATQQSVADAASDLGVVVDVIGDLADAADYLTLTDQTKGTHFDLGVAGAGVERALSTIAVAIAGQTDKQIRDGPTVHAGVDADETIALGLPSDARPSTLGIAFGSGSGELTTKEKANDFLRDIDDALLTIARYQADAGAIINRLEIAQQAQSGAVESTLSTITRMESADMALESSALARSRVRMEAANAALARAFAYQRSIASSMLSLIGGNFNGIG